MRQAPAVRDWRRLKGSMAAPPDWWRCLAAGLRNPQPFRPPLAGEGKGGGGLASRNTSVHWTCREISISHSPAAFTRSDVAVWLLGDAGPPPNPSGSADEAA